jgi:hypothetical protein
LGAAACSYSAPTYPNFGPYGSAAGVTAEAQKRSDKLEQYIKDWLDGKVSATIPNNLLPEGREPGVTNFTLKKPNEVNATKLFVERPAHTVNWAQSYGNFNESDSGYYVTYALVAPFGSKMIMEGTFPKARYFAVQATPSFKAENYRNGSSGEGETSWVDADIEPDAGSSNPYRVGANRNVANRNFKITCDMKIGDPNNDGAFNAPYYRESGNNRNCSGLTYRGPWGDPAGADGDKRGLFGPGELWMRIYGPDKGTGGYGGMAAPKLYYQLPDGRQYGIEADNTGIEQALNKQRALEAEAPAEPNVSLQGPGFGWDKQMSIFRSVQAGLTKGFNINGNTDAERRKYIRDLDLGVAGKGENAPGIMGKEPHSTGDTHVNYFTHGSCLGAGKVWAFAGRKPTTPKTKDGQAIMTSAQARWWSITGYSQKIVEPYGAELSSVTDENVITNANGDYVIMYGRATDRPANATAANGVTWVEWGPEACQSFTMRWLTVGPEWSFAKSPTFENVGWEGSWASASYDITKIGTNDRNGFLKEYQPVATYVTKAQFEALGNGFNPLTLPQYKG